MLGFKAVVLLGLVVALMIPLSMVRSTIHERSSFQYSARRDVAHSWGDVQELIGPFLLQSYEVEETASVWDRNLEAYVDETHWVEKKEIVFPENLTVDGNVDVERRYRGIYSIPVYRADLELRATLRLPEAPEEARQVRNRVLIGVSDIRGFRRQPVFAVNGTQLKLEPNVAGETPSGVQGLLADAEAGSYDVSVELALAGSSRLSLAPVGGNTLMSLSSNWPHPRFSGGYLPEDHQIGDSGFTANWQTSYYATTARDNVTGCVLQGSCSFDDTQLISIEMLDPVNVYLLNERSVKYGLLFVLIVFGVFGVYETLKRLAIHPVQYGMVGLGVAIFFLLLLSLSEHMRFAYAYLIGAGSCVSLLSFYVSYVLSGKGRGLGFGALLASIYGLLFVILQSEDYALLTGSALLFALLAGIMALTRKVDWYSLRAAAPRDTQAS